MVPVDKPNLGAIDADALVDDLLAEHGRVLKQLFIVKRQLMMMQEYIESLEKKQLPEK
jgi:hypothetical protein